MTPFYVTKCVCHHKSFEEIVSYATKHEMTTVEELREHEYCSLKCKMCAPYIELALESGETAFKPGCYQNRKMSS